MPPPIIIVSGARFFPDRQLPKLGGVQLIQKLKKMSYPAFCILMSGSPRAEDAKAGADARIDKTKYDELTAAISEAITKHRQRN